MKAIKLFQISFAGIALSAISACDGDYGDVPVPIKVDRVGMPAISTAVISAANQNEYNTDTPQIDATAKWASDITSNVTGLHAALDDDLADAGLAACQPTHCVAQAAPLIIPDVISIDISQPAGFPNGRLLADPVIDVTFALVLLDLSSTTGCDGGPCTALTLAGLPLNPPANDLAFTGVFPYLNPPHQPE
jgi:hypothetical protein